MSTNRATKLTTQDISQIKEMLKANMTHKQIAKKFGVARATITKIKSGTRWSLFQKGEK